MIAKNFQQSKWVIASLESEGSGRTFPLQLKILHSYIFTSIFIDFVDIIYIKINKGVHDHIRKLDMDNIVDVDVTNQWILWTLGAV